MPLTIADVAEAAGVSAATVDRALNGRAGVHARTRTRVLRAAHHIGYVGEPMEVARAAPASVRLAFVLPDGGNTFLKGLGRALLRACAAHPGVSAALHVLDGFRPHIVADGLRNVARTADGIGLVALDHPVVREAIREVHAQGRRVVTLVSDIGDVPRAAYVGIDNRAAGRLAGHLMGRFLGGPARAPAGEIALFAGSLGYRGHEEREMGFRRACAEDFPGLVLLPTQEVEDDAEQAYSAARAALAQVPALAGAYCLGGGVRGVARALAEGGRAGHVVFVGHELTEHTRRFLISGVMDAVIDQDSAAEAARAVDLLAGAVRGGPRPQAATLRMHAVFRENLPNSGTETEPGGTP